MKEQSRVALAILLSIFIIIFWTEIVVKPEEQKKLQEVKSQVQAASSPSTTTIAEPINTSTITAINEPKRSDYLQSNKLSIATPKYKLSLSLLGGRITSLKLNDYKAKLSEAESLELISNTGDKFPLGAWFDGLSDANVNYEVASVSGNATGPDANNIVVPPSTDLEIVLSGRLSDGREVVKKLFLNGRSFIFGVKLEAKDQNRVIPVTLEWLEHKKAEAEQNSYNLSQLSVLTADNKIERYLEADIKPKNLSANWLAFGDKYFFTALISPNINAPMSFDSQNDIIYMSSTKQSTDGNYLVYCGPKDREILLETGFSLTRTIDLGYFAIIGEPILWLLRVCFKALGNFGLAIILVTLMIKMLVLPLTKSAFKAMKAMQDLQPQIQSLREKITDSQQLNAEILALYKKHGINPMGGCLPTLLQLPVFLGMYNALQSSIELRHAKFALWITDLSSPEKLYVLGYGIPVMIFLMGASMYLQQKTQPQPADPQQAKMMMFMPIIFTGMFLFYPFPSGLVLYWLVNNIISIIQQSALRKAGNFGVLKSTIIGSLGIFGVAFLLTLL